MIADEREISLLLFSVSSTLESAMLPPKISLWGGNGMRAMPALALTCALGALVLGCNRDSSPQSTGSASEAFKPQVFTSVSGSSSLTLSSPKEFVVRSAQETVHGNYIREQNKLHLVLDPADVKRGEVPTLELETFDGGVRETSTGEKMFLPERLEFERRRLAAENAAFPMVPVPRPATRNASEAVAPSTGR
jgi:hypothetical protein